ncbi:MAG: DNA polymerase III subunit chi [Rhizobiales bacterium TMED83]|jgi:DNA polymerase-3 subunit chi|nr:DNA polymerase III subunit chi [Rhodobiaceae bacterium]RPF94966.1 MAG: DNA polymerase III subunit chi [Rhizobiales bacterium TMED83]HCD16551.1 DNA polymerase III subunit chi [Rhodobiaceae bacterium]
MTPDKTPDKTEVLFYHLERQTLEQVLPRLVQASLGRDWRVVVKAGSPERMQALNSHLWTWADDVFLPHAAAGDARFAEFAAEQPVWLTHEDDVPNDAHVLMLVDGAVPANLSRFQRCVFIFDGNDEAALATARADWSRLKAEGFDLTYWQQSPEGKWEKRG